MEEIKMLPKSQKEAIKACLAASKITSANERQYNLN